MVCLADTQRTNLTTIPSTNESPRAGNETGLMSKIDVFVIELLTPSTRLTLFSSYVLVGIIGFVGNIFVLCFLKSKKQKQSFMRACSFEKNFDVYIRSLAISDILCDVISIPPICIMFYFDVFKRGWGCKIVRYFNILFPCITMNNLLFISIEKYFSTREVPCTFSHSTVRKIVMLAWLAGFLTVLFPAATMEGMRFDLNDTHYTVVCRFNNKSLPFRIISLTYVMLQYIIPGCVITIINISLAKTLWTRLRVKVDVQRNNAIRMMYRAAAVRGTLVLITLTFAFVLPYLYYYGFVLYNVITKKVLDAQTDYVIRASGALVGYSNTAINVVIYMVQMKDFRAFVKKTITPRFLVRNGENNAEI